MTAKSLVISHICRRFTQKISMFIYCFQDTGEDQKELNIFMRCFARIQKIDSVICGKRPVVMLTGTVHTCKWFLMKDTAHSMTAGNLFKDTHHHLVLVCCDIDRCINRCKLMLCRSNLIMLCLCRNSKLPAFFIYLFHVCGNSLTDTSEVMVIHFLSLRRHSTKKGSACIDQVFSLKPFLFIDQEIFLLCSY